MVLAGAPAMALAAIANAGAHSLFREPQISEHSTAGVTHVTMEWSSTAGATCALRIQGSGFVAGFASRRVGASGVLAWGWAPPLPRAQAPWAFHATCRLGGYSEWFHTNVEMGIPRLAGALDVASALGDRSCDSQNLCFSDDPFPVGQCTWYALGRRPDLLGLAAGNAGSWLEDVKGRVPEGSAPVAGALAVWLPGYHGAGSITGHVAYVAEVSGTRVLLDDSNWTPTPTSARLEVHEHWVPAGAPTGYIYGGPAGNGPS